MKALLSVLIVLGANLAFAQSTPLTEDSLRDLFSSAEFVKTCPAKYLNYQDKAEGGPRAICVCPEAKVDYIDKTQGGPGFYCQE
jgi:hypothetical protein